MDGPDDKKWNMIIGIAFKLLETGRFDTLEEMKLKLLEKITGKDGES